MVAPLDARSHRGASAGCCGGRGQQWGQQKQRKRARNGPYFVSGTSTCRDGGWGQERGLFDDKGKQYLSIVSEIQVGVKERTTIVSVSSESGRILSCW